MFYVIKNNEVFEYGNTISCAWEYPAEAKELENIDMIYFEENKDKYSVIDGVLCDISQTPDYLNKTADDLKEKRILEIKDALNNLDLKCIRAIREGGEDTDGVTYLQKYQDEINALRTELNNLEQS